MSIADVIESIEKDMWRELGERIGEPNEEVDCRTLDDKPEYCSTCRYCINRDGECCNADSDYCGDFRCLDDSCEHWKGWD